MRKLVVFDVFYAVRLPGFLRDPKNTAKFFVHREAVCEVVKVVARHSLVFCFFFFEGKKIGVVVVDGTMLVASFDIGFRTFTSCLIYRERPKRTGTFTTQVLHWSKKDFEEPPWPSSGPVPGPIGSRADGFVRKLFIYLTRLFQYWALLTENKDIDRVIIEKQMRRNPKALFIQRKLRNFIAFLNNGEVPGISVCVHHLSLVPANIKTSMYSPSCLAEIKRGRKGYDARKKAAIKAAELVVPEGTVLDKDLADSLVQALAFFKKRDEQAAKRRAKCKSKTKQ